MMREEWIEQLESLARSRDLIAAWTPTDPEPNLLRCEQSRHRTLAHLRTCQEQWLQAARQFTARDDPSVRILHPWRQFNQNSYAEVPWQNHLRRFLDDRAEWLSW